MREHEGKLIRQLDQRDQEILELRSRMKSLTDKMSADRQRKMFDPPTKNRTRRLPAMPATNPDKSRLERMLKTLYSEKMGVERQLQVNLNHMIFNPTRFHEFFFRLPKNP